MTHSGTSCKSHSLPHGGSDKKDQSPSPVQGVGAYDQRYCWDRGRPRPPNAQQQLMAKEFEERGENASDSRAPGNAKQRLAVSRRQITAERQGANFLTDYLQGIYSPHEDQSAVGSRQSAGGKQ
jgi:hypothetical protein